MADLERLKKLVARAENDAAAEAKRGRFRIGVLAVLTVFTMGYSVWLHTQLGKLDAPALAAIARAEVQSRLPEMERELTELAIQSAPQVMDQAETALLQAPRALRGHLEERIFAGTDELVTRAAGRLEADIGQRAQAHLDLLRESGTLDLKTVQLDELMDRLRADYRDQATGLLDELYVGYSREISAVNDHLERLRTDEHLSRREQVQREIVAASAELRSRLAPLPPAPETGMSDDDR